METTIEKLKELIEKLKELYEKEERHNDASRDLRIEQIRLCKRQLLGKCFRVKGKPERTIKGEEYGTYVCFTDVVEEKNWDKDYYLLAIVIDFDDIMQAEDWGVQICYMSNDVSNWLDMAEDAEEISAKEFDKAKWRAIDFLGKKERKVTEED